MLNAITSLLKVSKPGDEFDLSFQDMKELEVLLQDRELLKQKYSLLLTKFKADNNKIED